MLRKKISLINLIMMNFEAELEAELKKLRNSYNKPK